MIFENIVSWLFYKVDYLYQECWTLFWIKIINKIKQSLITGKEFIIYIKRTGSWIIRPISSPWSKFGFLWINFRTFGFCINWKPKSKIKYLISTWPRQIQRERHCRMWQRAYSENQWEYRTMQLFIYVLCYCSCGNDVFQTLNSMGNLGNHYWAVKHSVFSRLHIQ